MTLPCLNLTTDVTPLPSAPSPTPGEVALVNDELLQNATNPVGPIIRSGGLFGWLKDAGVAKEDWHKAVDYKMNVDDQTGVWFKQRWTKSQI